MQIDLEIIIAANALVAIIINFAIINSTCGRVLLAQEVITATTRKPDTPMAIAFLDSFIKSLFLSL